MSDRLNSILSKLVTSIEGVKDEKEMLLRLIIGLAVFLLLALFRKQISKAIVWLCTKLLQEKVMLHKGHLLTHFLFRFRFYFCIRYLYFYRNYCAER